MAIEPPINAQIAEKIMEWKPWQSKHGYFEVEIPGETGRSSFGNARPRKYDSETGKKLPDPFWWEYITPDWFDTEISDAMRVVEKLWAGGKGWEFELCRSFVRGGEWLASFNNGGVLVEAHGLTAPIAICLAALQTLAP